MKDLFKLNWIVVFCLMVIVSMGYVKGFGIIIPNYIHEAGYVINVNRSIPYSFNIWLTTAPNEEGNYKLDIMGNKSIINIENQQNIYTLERGSSFPIKIKILSDDEPGTEFKFRIQIKEIKGGVSNDTIGATFGGIVNTKEFTVMVGEKPKRKIPVLILGGIGVLILIGIILFLLFKKRYTNQYSMSPPVYFFLFIVAILITHSFLSFEVISGTQGNIDSSVNAGNVAPTISSVVSDRTSINSTDDINLTYSLGDDNGLDDLSVCWGRVFREDDSTINVTGSITSDICEVIITTSYINQVGDFSLEPNVNDTSDAITSASNKTGVRIDPSFTSVTQQALSISEGETKDLIYTRNITLDNSAGSIAWSHNIIADFTHYGIITCYADSIWSTSISSTNGNSSTYLDYVAASSTNNTYCNWNNSQSISMTSNSFTQNTSETSNTTLQFVKSEETITNNANKSSTVSWSLTEPSGGTLYLGSVSGSNTINSGGTLDLSATWYNDWLTESLASWRQNTKFTTSANGTAYITREFNISNTFSIAFNNVDVTANLTARDGWTCSDNLTSVTASIGNNVFSYGINCTKSNVIVGTTNNVTPYSTETVVHTAYHTTNVTGYYNATINNTDNSIDFTSEFASPIPSPWSNTTDSTITLFTSNGTTNVTRVNLTGRLAYEDSYIETYQTGVGDETTKNTYIGYIIVDGNDSMTLPIRYKIPKSRLPSWENRKSSPSIESTVNGSSANITIDDTVTEGYVDFIVGSSHGSSSLGDGKWTWQLVYYVPVELSSPGPGGGGGGGTEAGIPPPLPFPEEEEILPVNFEVFPSIFNLTLTPNIKTNINITVLNREDDIITIGLEFLDDVDYISTDFEAINLDNFGELIIPMKISSPLVLANKRIIVKVTAKRDLIKAVKEIPIYINMVENKTIGEICYDDKECETGICSMGICQPTKKKTKGGVNKFGLVLIISSVIAILGVSGYLIFRTPSKKEQIRHP